jgi:hypothetical protein
MLSGEEGGKGSAWKQGAGEVGGWGEGAQCIHM